MAEGLRFVVVTGLSGAGKSKALHMLEDLGYFCVDNLPAELVPTFAELVSREPSTHPRVALCVDARSGKDLVRLPAYLDGVQEHGVRPEVLFLDSDTNTLVKRYSESRRPHPLARGTSLDAAIEAERQQLDPVRARADLLLDTSDLSLAALRERVSDVFSGGRDEEDMAITIMSFGFKYGVPQEADVVFDVRFLPNPFYDEELRDRTGTEPDVRDYVLKNDDAQEFMRKGRSMLEFLIPRYAAEPKTYLTIAVGCTGGQHRSVAVAHEIAVFLRTIHPNLRLRHRDITRVR